MIDIVALLHCTSPYLTDTTIRQLSRVILAILMMTGRVTMLGISRWTDKGGSYRTIQRLFNTTIPWAMCFWLFFRQHLYQPGEVYIWAGDESVVSKSGQKTYGLDHFFSSLYGKPIPGVSFFALSLISTQERRSYPMMIEQIVKGSEREAVSKDEKVGIPKAQAQPGQGPVGRPKGSKNKDKRQVVMTDELEMLHNMLQKQRLLSGETISAAYLTLDGKFGHNAACQVVQGVGLHLISKLRHDAALYLPYDGPYAGRGPRRKYGTKIDYDQLPDTYLKQTTVTAGVRTNIYQMTVWHKEFPDRINVVIIHKTKLSDGAMAHVVLFSSDLDLGYEQLIDYYGLRFQIEFNFRDAKQYWGLEDFMNVQPTPVTNAANLAFFMVNVAHLLLRSFRQTQPALGILDLKAHFRGYKYVSETLKLLPQKPEPILMTRILDRMSRLGSIHNPLASFTYT